MSTHVITYRYLYTVQPKKKILSVSLLAIYLMTALQSIASPLPPETLHHHHEDFGAVHHEHAFHIGIFHFFGHLLDKIAQQDDLTDDYLQPEFILPIKQLEDGQPITDFNHCLHKKDLAECDVNINDPPDFPPYLFLSQSVNFAAHPLRAPPSC